MIQFDQYFSNRLKPPTSCITCKTIIFWGEKTDTSRIQRQVEHEEFPWQPERVMKTPKGWVVGWEEGLHPSEPMAGKDLCILHYPPGFSIIISHLGQNKIMDSKVPFWGKNPVSFLEGKIPAPHQTHHYVDRLRSWFLVVSSIVFLLKQKLQPIPTFSKSFFEQKHFEKLRSAMAITKKCPGLIQEKIWLVVVVIPLMWNESPWPMIFRYFGH